MTKLKEQIKDLMKGKEKMHLKELYKELETKPASVRATINLSIKKDEGIFDRLGKGFYKIKKLEE